MTKKIPLVYQGYVFSHVGFAEATRNYIMALDRTGKFKIKIFPFDLDNIQLKNTKETARLKQFVNTKITERPIWITETGPMQINPTVGYSIGLVVWECEEWPRRFIKNLKKQDEIWAACEWNKEGMEKNGISDITVMQHALDYKRFDPALVKPLRDRYRQDFFRFLTIMGWSERKGVSALLQAYNEEFNRDDDVFLYIKINHYDIQKAQKEIAYWASKCNEKGRSPYIILDPTIYSWEDMPRLYKGADAFVLPSRGEGFGLNFAEAMLMELPTIGTAHGPMLDYMDETNSFPVKILPSKVDRRMDWIVDDYKGKKWPVIDVKDLRRQMRYVFENRVESRKKAKKARKDIIKYCSPSVVGKKIASRLEEIWETMEHRKLKKPISIQDVIKYE